MPFHTMIFLGPSQFDHTPGPYVAYHTGPPRRNSPPLPRRAPAPSRPAMAPLRRKFELPGHLPLEHPLHLYMKRFFPPALPISFLVSAQTDEQQPFFSLNSVPKPIPPARSPRSRSPPSTFPISISASTKSNDPLKFFKQLPDAHQFGGEAQRPARDLTLIEKFHHLKASWHTQMRFLVRDQFDEDAWKQVRTWRVGSPENDRETISNVTQFAALPVLNQQQLVATWRQHVKSEGRWRQQAIPVEISGKGVYLVEAVFKDKSAYTLLMISDLSMITKTAQGRVVAFTVDRKSGNPIPNVTIQTASVTTKTDAHGLADLAVAGTKNPNSDQPQIFAMNGPDFAVSSLSSYTLASDNSSKLHRLRLHRPPRLPPRPPGAFQVHRARPPRQCLRNP